MNDLREHLLVYESDVWGLEGHVSLNSVKGYLIAEIENPCITVIYHLLYLFVNLESYSAGSRSLVINFGGNRTPFVRFVIGVF